MTAHIHLVRHGHHALLGRILCGRMPGVYLDERGCREMAATAEAMWLMEPRTIQSSPQRRALQSASIIASRCGLPVEVVPAFDEIDMGLWTGARFADLAEDVKWQQWNERRDIATPPDGESMAALQNRAIGHLQQLTDHEGSIVIVSHAEPIRAALMYYLGIPLDLFYALEVDPGSVSTIVLEGKQTTVASVNKVVWA